MEQDWRTQLKGSITDEQLLELSGSAGACRYCARPRPRGYSVTCGGSYCQEQNARDNRARRAEKRRESRRAFASHEQYGWRGAKN